MVECPTGGVEVTARELFLDRPQGRAGIPAGAPLPDPLPTDRRNEAGVECDRLEEVGPHRTAREEAVGFVATVPTVDREHARVVGRGSQAEEIQVWPLPFIRVRARARA